MTELYDRMMADPGFAALVIVTWLAFFAFGFSLRREEVR